MLGSNPSLPAAATRNSSVAPPASFPDGSSPPAVKTRLCNKFSSGEGCKFGDKCHFAHGERELGKPTLLSHEDPRASRYGMEPTPSNLGAAARFGVSATAKISIDAAMAGAVIGKGGVNSKQICRLTGAKLSVRDHESDPNLRNIELEGTFDQIKHASQMVRELIMNVSASSGHSMTKNTGAMSGHSHSHAPGGSNFKTKLCENFTKGSCTFGDRCHFAHGQQELRRSGV
ncbi:hypothetical protein ACS0TY_007295 [Phlomoides rotata]